MSDSILDQEPVVFVHDQAYRGENWAWMCWHRARLHDVDPWGWCLGPHGVYRNWICVTCGRTWR